MRMTDPYWIPVNPEDVPALEVLLHDANPFVSVALDTHNPYRLIQYRQHVAADGEPIRALLDRNLTTRISRLAAGAVVSHSEETAKSDRVAAGCMAFLAAAGIGLQPNVSLYELAAAVGGDKAIEEFSLFRLAEEVQPQAFLNVALQRASFIHPDTVEDARTRVLPNGSGAQSSDLEVPLRQFRAQLATLTKLAILDRTPLDNIEKFRRLLLWSDEDAFFSGAALGFATIFLGTKRRGSMLKGIRSTDFQACLKGLRNAAWDLTYIAYWTSLARTEEGKALWLLCTNDTVCKAVARATVGPPGACTERLFAENYPTATARKMYSQYQDVWEHVASSSSRVVDVAHRLSRVTDIQTRLELELEAVVKETS